MFENQFEQISLLIEESRKKAFQSVNKALILLYWKIGQYISQQVSDGKWGDGTVRQLADYLAVKQPGLKGFNRRGLYRMMQFYEAYKNDEIVSSVMTQISWTHHVNILASTKTIEEREFYLRLTIRDRLSVRELRRQMDTAVFERTILADKKLPPALMKLPQEVLGQFKDTYVLDFLHLPETHSEADLQKAMLRQLKKLILDIGKDFALVGEEFRLQMGMHDYSVDLLFFHRELRCLIPVELKIEDFKPDHVGRLNFYLEALDRDVKKPHENPSIGILLCKGKDDEVVEYAMSRSMSPALIAEYSTHLIDKELLRQKVHELFLMEEAKLAHFEEE